MIDQDKVLFEIIKKRTLELCLKGEEIGEKLSHDEIEILVSKLIRELVEKAVMIEKTSVKSVEEVNSLEDRIREVELFALDVCREYFSSVTKK